MTKPMSVNGVLRLDVLSESIRYRCHKDEIEGRPLLEWWLHRMSTIPGLRRLHVIGHSRADVPVSDMLGDAELFLDTESVSERQSLADVSRRLGEPVLALLPLGMALAPPDLLQRAYAHHVSCGNAFTTVNGLPAGTTPVILQSELLAFLEQVGVRDLPGSIAAAIARLKQLARSLATEIACSVRNVPFDGTTAYGGDPALLPRGVRLELPEDVETLRRVVARMNGDGDALRGLRLWKQEKIGQNARSLETRASIPVPAAERSPRRRILYVSNPSGFSGAEQSLCQLLEHIDSTRFEAHALVARDGTFADALRRAGAAVGATEFDFGRPTVANIMYADALLDRLAPSIVHLNSADAIFMVVAARRRNVPIVLHVRNGVMSTYSDVVGSAHGIIAVSEFLKREIQTFDIDPRRVHVIYDEVDTEHFRKGSCDPQAARRELNIPESAKVVLMIARYAANKRHDLMLEAFAKVRQVVPAAHLVLKGDLFSAADADLHARVRAQAEALELTDSMTWLRFVPDIRVLHEAADALVLCSDREGLGRCVVEAMAMELPVIVTDSGGTHELVGADERGFSVRAGDACDLAEKIVRVLSSPASLGPMLAAARAFSEGKLSARMSAAAVMALYDEITAGAAAESERGLR